MMSSAAFERSLRGGGTSSSSSSMAASSSSSSTSSLRPPKKKSVTWDDDEVLQDDSGGESGVLRNSSIACTNTNNGGAAAAAAAAAAAGAGAIHEPQSFDHLRVPAKASASSTRVVDAAANQHNHGVGSASGGGGLLASARKRVGAAEQTRGIQMGPLRVRTPAKPKRSRADATPFHAPSSSSVPAPSAGATHNYLRRGGGTAAAAAAAAVASSPTNRSSPTSAAGGAARRPRSPSLARSPTAAGAGRWSPPLHPSRIPRTAEPTAARPGAAATPGAAGSTRNRSSPRRQRHMSSSQALRNVAGGNGEDDDDAEVTFMEDDNRDHGEGAEGDGNGGAAAPVDGPSPMSLLSNTLSAIGLAVGVGKPPRSPRASKGSPRLSISGSGSSPRVSPRSSPRAAARSRTSPFFDTCGSGGGCEGLPRMLEEDEEEDFPLGVARQSLESRLADAAAASSSLAAVAHRASVENMQNNSPATSLSPFTKSSTTVRRTSTSRYNVNGEPSSVVSEEVSEESSVTVTSAACGCHHQHGCAIGAIGGQMPAGDNGFSVEVRDRLKELQGRTTTTATTMANDGMKRNETTPNQVNLTLALAPLEERLQAKERAWESERRELVSRSEANLRSARVAEDRCREVERRKSEMEEERHSLDAELRRLRGEIEQRESKTAASFWQRTVAADREKTRLENALDQAEAKVVTLGKEKSELEAGLMPIQSENSSLKFRLIEAEKVASRVLTAEEGLRFSETQLEVLKSELAATSAQLTAVQTELAQQKAGARKQLEEKERKAGDDMSSLRMEMQRLQETICSQADRVVAASMSELSPTNDTGGRAMVTAQAETGSAVALSDAALSSEAARIRQQELSSLRSRLEVSLERTRVLEKQVEEGEEERRRMHNAILDLTGSVRVYVRARPFLKSDGEQAVDQGEAVVRCGADATSIAVLPPDAPNRSISCAFDHVFGGHASQEDVFKEVSSFVQSALD
ncbi:unnamed protein product, partial [Ectocarpus sp. 12 AP-2014]